MKPRAFLALLAFATALRLPLLFEDFWYDENFTLRLAQLPFEKIVAATASDVHPPLFYFIEALWVRLLGAQPNWLIRVPSLLAGLGALVLFYLVLRALELPRSVQTLALVFMTVAPFQIHYSAEARMYALLCLLVMGCTWAVLTRHWKTLALLLTGLILTHNWGLLYAASLGFLALIRHPQDWKRFIPAFGLPALAWLPWALVLRQQMQFINHTYWIAPLTLDEFLVQFYFPFWDLFLYNPVLVYLTFGWILLGIFLLIKNHRPSWHLLIVALFPLLAAAIISITWQSIILYRAMIGAAPLLYILLALPLSILWDNAQKLILRRGLVAAIILLPLLLIAYSRLYSGTNRYDNSRVLEYIEAHWQPGDLIVTTGDRQYLNLVNYTDKPLVFIPECDPTLGAVTAPTRAALGYNEVATWDDLPASRLWVFWSRTPFVQPCQIEQMNQRLQNISPALVDEDDPQVYTALWLLER